jgi:hypothetical protein
MERLGRWDEALSELDRLPASGEIDRIRRRIQAKRKLFARIDGIVRAEGGRSFLTEEGSAMAVRGRVEIELLPPAAEIDLPLLFRAVEETRIRFEKSFGEVEGEVRIRVYPTRSRIDMGRHPSVLETPGWAAGVGGEIVRLFVGGAEPPPPHSLACLVAHETCHLLMARLTGGRCPRWLDEGLAIHFSQELPPRYASLLDRAIAEDRHLPLDLLAGPFDVLEDPDLIDLAYSQAASVAGFLMGEPGPERLGGLLQKMAEGSADEALASGGLTPWLVERNWLLQRKTERGS